MPLRTTMPIALLVGFFTLSTVPVAAAAPSCSDSAGAGSFSVGCTMNGTCFDFCILRVNCTASYVGIATGTCAGRPMVCHAAGCTGFNLVGVTGSWTLSCRASGTTLTSASISCSVN